MRPPAGVLIVTQVDELVLRGGADRSFSLAAQGSATEQSADQALAFAETDAQQVIVAYAAPRRR